MDAGQIQLLAGGKLTMKAFEMDTNHLDFSDAEIVVTRPPHQLLFEKAGYQLHEFKPVSPVLIAFPRLTPLIQEKKTNAIWIAVKPAESHAAQVQK